jgi:hypothetical protein
MNPIFRALVESIGVVAIWELIVGFLCQSIAKLPAGVADRFARAPIVDVLVAMVTWVPWVWGVIFARWVGLAGAVLGQMMGLYVWCFLHEMVYREAARGPRIIKYLDRTVGRWQNHLALWVTLIAVPGFWLIRLMEVVSYLPLVWLLDFPKYRQGEWINVSRQKFSGLVGHDLVWCLYCDWMTGVYSLGAEMLRNVESFWCPIRFYEGKKCDNCKVDFPDIEHSWVRADGTMEEVVKTLEVHYGDGRREWSGHPARLTVKGRVVGADTASPGAGE